MVPASWSKAKEVYEGGIYESAPIRIQMLPNHTCSSAMIPTKLTHLPQSKVQAPLDWQGSELECPKLALALGLWVPWNKAQKKKLVCVEGWGVENCMKLQILKV